MKVSELGEFGLIARLAAVFARGGQPPGLLIGIGDDAAAWRASGVQLVTTDTLIEGVHFRLSYVPWRDLGWNALAVNVSDIGAMGGMPEQALLTLALPLETEVADVDQFLAGMLEAGSEYGTAVVGGDIVACDRMMVTVMVIGRALADDQGEPLLMTRSAAQPGDAIAVTGHLGDSAAGLRILLGERAGSAEAADYLKRAHLHHRPPLSVGQMAAREGVRAAIDVSDGLLQDLGHVCQASGRGAVVHAERIPISPALRQAFPQDALALACGGGEDYQLLLIAPPEIIDRVRSKAEPPMAIIGEMVVDPEHRVRLVSEDGREVTPPSAGWDHLRGTTWRR
ncbi:MAG: thiamine-phosphate kinase [Dehalococcoidia bacterium]